MKYLIFNIRVIFFIITSILFQSNGISQIINYVNNPSFETALPTASFNPSEAANFWGAISAAQSSYIIFGKTLGTAPNCSYGFQYPRTGNNFIGTAFYCNNCVRWYPRNKLKQSLKPNIAYCAKYYVVNANNSRIGIDSYGIHFGGSTIDTITKCMVPLTYLIPQVENTVGNVITDTLSWTAITGTFVANGAEKYMILGNFKSNASTNTLLINTPTLTTMSSDIYIDDVSLIELDLPAFAGKDTAITPNDSVFIGRQPDVGIDEACFWYKLPSTITPTTPAIDTVAGLWIKPISTSTYVVRQQIWCGTVKYDTVVIYMNAVGFEKLKILSEELKIYPIPAKEHFELRVSNDEWMKEFNTLLIYNNLGMLLREEELKFKNGLVKIEVGDLPNGAYSIKLKSSSNEIISKRFIINR